LPFMFDVAHEQGAIERDGAFGKLVLVGEVAGINALDGQWLDLPGFCLEPNTIQAAFVCGLRNSRVTQVQRSQTRRRELRIWMRQAGQHRQLPVIERRPGRPWISSRRAFADESRLEFVASARLSINHRGLAINSVPGVSRKLALTRPSPPGEGEFLASAD